MPGERLTLRSTSEIGRFPGVAPPTRVEVSIQKEADKKQEEGGCRQWLRKICLCCCKAQNSTSYDITEKVEWIKGPTPEPVKPIPEKPENGEIKETEGNLGLWIVVCILNTSFNTGFDKGSIQLLSLSEVKLSVCSVDLLSSKKGQNRVEHHTNLYHGDELIIRRGQTFQIEMELNRPFNADNDKMHLELKTGNTLIKSFHPLAANQGLSVWISAAAKMPCALVLKALSKLWNNKKNKNNLYTWNKRINK